jgi:hypothetical protein
MEEGVDDKASAPPDADPSGDPQSHTQFQFYVQAFFDSVPVTAFVMLLVCIQVGIVSGGVDNIGLECAYTAFYTLEVSARIWAHRPRFYFQGYYHDNLAKSLMDSQVWLNWIDFTLVLMDLTIYVTLTYLVEYTTLSPGMAGGTKSLRLTRLVKLVRLVRVARVLRLLRLLRMIIRVFDMERAQNVQARRKSVFKAMYAHRNAWKIPRGGGQDLSQMYPFADTDPFVREIWERERDAQGEADAQKRPRKHVVKLAKQLRRKRFFKDKGTGEVRAAWPGESGGHPISLCTSVQALSTYFGSTVGMYFWTGQLFVVVFAMLLVAQLPSILWWGNKKEQVLKPPDLSLKNASAVFGTLSGKLSGLFSGGGDGNASSTPDGLREKLSAIRDCAASACSSERMFGTAACVLHVEVEAFVSHDALLNYTRAVSAALAAGTEAPPAAAAGATALTKQATCYINDAQMVSGVASIAIIVWAFWYFRTELKRMLRLADASHATANDFTVEVGDPEPDARSVDEWQAYFSKFGAVAAVTVVLDNADLLLRLARRRYLMRQVRTREGQAESWPGVSTRWKRQVLQLLGMGKDRFYWMEQYSKNELECARYMEQEYYAVKVYVSFEDEAGRRACCNRLMQGFIPAQLNIAFDLPRADWFRGENVLSVKEPCEPEAVHFPMIGMCTPEQISMQHVVMTTFLALSLLVQYLLLRSVHNIGHPWAPLASAVIISGLNVLYPRILHKMSDLLETHESEGAQLSADFHKITLFRYWNTVIVVFILNGFEARMQASTLTRVQNILLFDAVLTPLLHVSQHQLATFLSRFTQDEESVLLMLDGDKVLYRAVVPAQPEQMSSQPRSSSPVTPAVITIDTPATRSRFLAPFTRPSLDRRASPPAAQQAALRSSRPPCPSLHSALRAALAGAHLRPLLQPRQVHLRRAVLPARHAHQRLAGGLCLPAGRALRPLGPHLQLGQDADGERPRYV